MLFRLTFCFDGVRVAHRIGVLCCVLVLFAIVLCVVHPMLPVFLNCLPIGTRKLNMIYPTLVLHLDNYCMLRFCTNLKKNKAIVL